MDIHPLVVHFPIVCLVLYSVLEILSVFKISWRVKFRFTKMFLLIIGLVGAFTALQTGEIAKESMGNGQLVNAHEDYATIAYKLYLIIGFLYLISREQIAVKVKNNLITKIVSFINGLHRYGVVALLALVACIALSIAGALGGAISHGTNTDPIVKFVYDLIIK